MNKLSVKMNKRRFKHGSFATIITVGFIVLVVLLNIALNIVFQIYPLSIDLTSDNRFSISNESVKLVSNLKENVDVVVFCEETQFANANTYYKQAYEIIKDYQKRNSTQIKIKFVDTVKNPDAAQAYPDLTLTTGDIVVQSSKRYRKLTTSDLFEVSTTDYGDTKYYSKAEQAMTNAILYVTDTDPVTAVVLNVPSKVDVSAYSEILKSNNYTIKTQTLQTEELDKDADLLILPQPSSELSFDTIKKISDFLDNDSKFGKNIIFIPDNVTPIDETLGNFLKDWGIEVGNSIIYETNSTNYRLTPNQVSMSIADSDFKTAMNSSLLIISGNTRPIKTLFTESANRGTKAIMTSSETAVLKPFNAGDNFDIAAQTKGTQNGAVCSFRYRYDNEGNKIYSNVFVIGSSDMLSSTWLGQAGFGNAKFGITSANSITENKDTFTAINIDMTTTTLSITSDQTNIYRIVLLYVIPILLLAGGLVVFLRRRHL